MLVRFIRYFKGYLRIRISGSAIERFLNACSKKGILLWNLTSANATYELNIFIRDFKRLKPIIRKTRTKVLIIERIGFPFFLQKYSHRKMFFTGFFCCIFLTYLFSTIIWDIKVIGNLQYTSETIEDFLNEMSVKEGMWKNKADCFDIARQIRRNFDEIIWVSASLEGTNLIIHIKENEDSYKKENSEEESADVPYDIVANDDYFITNMIVRNGIANVKEGDTVKSGTKLVSGQIPIYNDAKEIIDYQYCSADADITGRTTISYKDSSMLSYYDKESYNISKEEYFLCIGNYRFLFGGIQNEYTSFEQYSYIKQFRGISFGKRTVFPYKKTKQIYTKKQIQKMLSLNFKYYCNELKKKGVEILQNDVKIYTWSDRAEASGTLLVEMPAGRKQISKIIEIGDPTDGNDGNNN